MKANKIFSMITAAALAVSAFSAVTFTVSAATTLVDDAAFTAGNIPEYYSTTAAEEGKTLAVDSGYLKADRSTNNNVPANHEFVTIKLDSSKLKANDALSISFTYTNGNWGTPSAAQVYMICGDAEMSVGETTALKGGTEGTTDFTGIAQIPSSYTSGDIKVVLKVSASTNSPRIKNVKINTVDRVEGIGDGVKTVNDDFSNITSVPDYYALKCTVDDNAALKISSNALAVDTEQKLPDGDGVFVNMTGIESGKKMNLNLSYGTGNYTTPAMIQLYEEIDGLLQSRVIAVSESTTGANDGTLSADFDVPAYTTSYRLLIATYTDGKGVFAEFKLKNLYINPVIEQGVTSVKDDYATFGDGADKVPSYLSLKYTTEKESDNSTNPPSLKIGYYTSTAKALLVNGTNFMNGSGILVNMTGINAGQTMNLSLKYGTGNEYTPAIIQLFEEIDGVIQTNAIATSEGVRGDDGNANDGSLNCTFNVSEYSKSYRLLIGAYTNGGNGINGMKLFNLYINPVQVTDIAVADGTEVSGTEEYAEQKSTYYTTTITPDPQTYTTLNVSGTLKNAVNGTASFSKDTAISDLSGEGSYLIGIIIETTKDNIDTLSVTLK